METQPAPATPYSPPPKKGLGTGAKVGIGCGAFLLLAVIALILIFVTYGDKMRDFAQEAQTNPTRAAANLMVSASGGDMEMIAEDDVNKRYTLRDKESGELTTIYWSEAKNGPEVIQGDFSAIPGATPVLETDQPPTDEPSSPSVAD